MRCILTQDAVVTGRVELDYVVMDGASTDGSVGVARDVAADAMGNVRVISEPDSGMYDALAKGFAVTSGDIRCYLNAGDLWLPWALDVVADVFEQRQDLSWICGYYGRFNVAGQLTDATLPFRFRRRLILAGLYDGLHLPLVQQETTFWRDELMRLVDYQQLAELAVAGDFFLWRSFAVKYRLTVIGAVLGGWRVHPGHLGADLERYRREMRSLAPPPTMTDRVSAALERRAWALPRGVRSSLARDHFLPQGLAGTW